jgi:hypothetical protein
MQGYLHWLALTMNDELSNVRMVMLIWLPTIS